MKNFFLKAAYLLGQESKCVSRQVGCIIAKDDRIISTGINGTPPGFINCHDKFPYYDSSLLREQHHCWSKIYEIHAEMNAYEFASRCKKLSFNPLDSVNSIKQKFIRDADGGGTYWSSIFPVLSQNGAYDRVFIMSDEQGADEVESSYKAYCQQFGTPHVYVINLCGYGPTMIKQNTKVHRIFGYTADIYETAKKTEIDVNVVLKEIEAIEI